jgi:hypothetical protein
MTQTSADLISEECDKLKALLLEKNAAYGDSALDPLRVMSKASPVEQILVRIDDKLSRLARGAAAGEDVVQDLMGYLVLLRVAQRKVVAPPVVDGAARWAVRFAGSRWVRTPGEEGKWTTERDLAFQFESFAEASSEVAMLIGRCGRSDAEALEIST